jgi:amino acid permease
MFKRTRLNLAIQYSIIIGAILLIIIVLFSYIFMKTSHTNQVESLEQFESIVKKTWSDDKLDYLASQNIYEKNILLL